ncbi:MAG: leucine-rich repeat protein [Lachnospiraceae bacterium]|nr:leucine-rich repeat protein [Lachnospiraceae bacterium]
MKRRVAWFMAIILAVITPTSSVFASEEAVIIVEDEEDVLDTECKTGGETIEESEPETETGTETESETEGLNKEDGIAITSIEEVSTVEVDVKEENETKVCTLDDVGIDETNFPDESFRKYVSENFDLDEDGYLSGEEIGNITDINLDSLDSLDSLEGIEYFSELISLQCDNKELDNLDVSSNTKLEGLYCNGNNLGELDVSSNTALIELDCSDNKLNSDDFCLNTSLVSLKCGGNYLSSLDVSENTSLVELDCKENDLDALDVSNNILLESLNCSSNNLKSLNVSNNTAILSLNCEKNNLGSLNVSENIALEYLNCAGNNISVLNAYNNTALEKLDCSWNYITYLNVSMCSALSELYCENQNAYVDTSGNFYLYAGGCMELKYLDCSVSKLYKLDVSDCTALEVLYCNSNNLNSLDVSNCSALEELHCGNNNLSSLEISNCTNLEVLSCDTNNLSSLDITTNTKLKALTCWGQERTVLAYKIDGMVFISLEELVGSDNFENVSLNSTDAVIAGNYILISEDALSESLTYKYSVNGDSVNSTMDVKLTVSTIEGELDPKLEQNITGIIDYVKTIGDMAFALDVESSAGVDLTYESMDAGVAVVSSEGIVTIIGAGTTQITVVAAETGAYKSATATLSLTVEKKTREITGTDSYVKTIGDTAFTLDAIASDGAVLSYVSSDEDVISVSPDGLITINGVGTANVTISAAETAEYQSTTAIITVTVQEAVLNDDGDDTQSTDTSENDSIQDGSSSEEDNTQTENLSEDDNTQNKETPNGSETADTGSQEANTVTDSNVKIENNSSTFIISKGTTWSDETTKYTVTASGEDGMTMTVTALQNRNATNVTIPATVTIDGTVYSVTAIADSAFANCTKLKRVTIGENITSIGKKAFYKCTSLTKVSGFASVVSIGNSAFYGCKKLKKVNLTSTALTTIGASAFQGCTSMTSFTSKSTKLKSIGKKAFYGCKKLATVSLKTTKLKKSGVKANAFKGIKSTCTFKVPASKVSAYKKIFKARGAGSKIRVKKL